VKELNQDPQTRNEVKRVAGQKAIIPIGQIEQRILLIRGQRVMLDADLAMLYGVPTRVLNQAVRRNLKRFPQDFMFKLTQPEKNQVITNCDHLKNLKYAKALPNAFNEPFWGTASGMEFLGSIGARKPSSELTPYSMRLTIEDLRYAPCLPAGRQALCAMLFLRTRNTATFLMAGSGTVER
jgi:hypothetical protein